ncbi:VCBS repeat-containing protein [Euzebyella saccharophila]|uniref:VCBS repeat-containing protein n=1 Tax=Euzebyella saccharophila TaxID=679664 RepID=A0ABV8JK28_9FLAO|nr:VCBS repeat-containing protein [Euzebyella saccharophila]
MVSIILNFSCSEKEQVEKVNDTSPLFTVLSMEETGLNFNNKLEESTTMNGFYYEYFYNGGGVAVADFNNDGLQDIYFVSNLRTNKLYLNKGGLKFKNVSVKANAQGSGGFPTGVTVVDINNDGLKDIYILKSGRFETDEPLRNELLINKGPDENNIPIFEESAQDFGLDLPHYSTQASFFDYDRDGDLDMFLVNHNIEIYEIDDIEEIRKGQSAKIGEKLYRNDNGQFVNVTEKAGIISNNLGFGLGVAIGDVNNDGWPDVYTSNDYYQKDHLYLNNQDGTFTETSLVSFNHMSTFSMGSDIADINNDGLMDLVSLDMMAEDNYTQKTSMSGMNVADFYMIENLGLHRQYMYNALQVNNGTFPKTDIPAFSDVAQMAGISSTDWSWAPLLFDMDNDGYRDLFVSNGIKRDFRNNDFLIYLEKKYQEGVRKKKVDLAKHVNDLLERLPERGKKNYLYLNKGDLSFRKIDLKQPTTYSNGAAYADFDNDGDLDIVVNNTDDFVHLYRNNQSNNNFLQVNLKGPAKNIDGIGARIEVVIDESTLTAENYFTRGFQSAMAVPLHFGLGDSKVDSIKVIWPDGKYQMLSDVESNTIVTIAYDPSRAKKIENDENNYNFKDVTEVNGIDFKHEENDYNDFDLESLLPHKMSQFGPCLSVSDVNNDGLEDFYIGGAMGQAAALFLQTTNEGFKKISVPAFNRDRQHEDTGSLFLDADGDGDQDLYVVSGGNEMKTESAYYQDRFYKNDGQGNFTRVSKAIPDIVTSGQAITALDFDKDGDLDLFVGSRVKPRNYGYSGKSYLLENTSTAEKIRFEDVTTSLLPELLDFGMVTDVLWVDLDGKGGEELILSQEWGNIQAFSMQNGKFVSVSEKFSLNDNVGWWNSLAADDIDNDGDIDLIAGNLGLNYKYKATQDEPFHLYLNDFDGNNTNDIVLGYEQDNTLYPLRGRECTSNQMPFVKKKFKTYEEFGKASLQDVFGEALDNSIHRAATNFASSILENTGNKGFEFKPLPNPVQISSINKIITRTRKEGQKSDLILLGNMYGSEVETPRNDASYGHYLKNMGNGKYQTLAAQKSGLYVRGDVRGAAFISLGSEKKEALLIARNNARLMLLEL